MFHNNSENARHPLSSSASVFSGKGKKPKGRSKSKKAESKGKTVKSQCEIHSHSIPDSQLELFPQAIEPPAAEPTPIEAESAPSATFERVPDDFRIGDESRFYLVVCWNGEKYNFPVQLDSLETFVIGWQTGNSATLEQMRRAIKFAIDGGLS